MIIKVNFIGQKLKFYLERRSDFSAFYQVFVERTYQKLTNKIKQGDVVIDAGANIGIFTVMSSILVGNTGRVLSIEPDPENISVLKKNIELNRLKNVEIVNKALYEESGKKIKFTQNGVMSKIITDSIKTDSKTIDVETITFDDLISQKELKPNILKMDIEGAEKFALLSAENMMKTLNYFEDEIHSKDDMDILERYSNSFSIRKEQIKSMHNVFSFGFKHPLKTLKLEYYNKFKTTKWIISSRMLNHSYSEFPIIIYGESFPQDKQK